jgi:hypothetical protein
MKSFPVISEEAMCYGIFLTPGVVVNDRVISTEKIISEEELKSVIAEELGVK